MTDKTPLPKIRREFGQQTLDEHAINADPILQFQQWFVDVSKTEISDPTAMILATVDEHGVPDTRTLLLKDIMDDHFIFYTNYQSAKAQQIEKNPHVSLNFYWPVLARQVRIRGIANKVADKIADDYFQSRPRSSQISAIASPQSGVIPSREFLETEVKRLEDIYKNKIVPRPTHWGGYQVKPHEIEFWQGRDNRLHDRLRYTKKNNQWIIERLGP